MANLISRGSVKDRGLKNNGGITKNELAMSMSIFPSQKISIVHQSSHENKGLPPSLDTLPSSIMKDISNVPEHDDFVIALNQMESDDYDFTKFRETDWYKNIFIVKVTLSMPSISTDEEEEDVDDLDGEPIPGQTFTLTMTIFHLMIMLRKQKTIKRLLESGFSNGDWMKTVQIDGPNWTVVEEEKWIFEANCLHLAAKFNHTALHLLLSQLDNKESLILESHKEGKISPLHLAAAKIDDARCTCILLYHGAPVDCLDEQGYTPLFFASKSGSLADMITLIKQGANVNHVAKNGKTPLFRARTYETVMLLLNYGANPYQKTLVKDKLGNPTPTTKVPRLDGKPSPEERTVTEHLMRYGYECPRAILDESIQKLPDDTLVMDFEVFNCNNALKEFELQDYEMSLFVEVKEKGWYPLLAHPLMQIFLNLKWRAIGAFFWLKLFFQVILVATMTYNGIMFVNIPHCEIVCEDGDKVKEKYNELIKDFNPTCSSTHETYYSDKFHKILLQRRDNNTENETVRCINRQLVPQNVPDLNLMVFGRVSRPLEPICKAFDMTVESCWSRNWSVCVMAFLLFVFFLREAKEIYERGIMQYIKYMDNWIQECILILSISFLALSTYDYILAIHCAAWMVFLVWIDLTLLLSKLDKIGEYVYMSKNVTKTMLFCMVTYIPSFLAYAFGFYLLLRSNENFNSYVATVFKVLSMMVGELEYDGTFSYDAVVKTGSRQFSTQIMFLFFLITVALIIMNLLLAVTVSKTDDLEQSSKLMQSRDRVEDVVQHSFQKKLTRQIMDYLACANISSMQFFWQRQRPVLERCLSDGDRKYKVCIRSGQKFRYTLWNRLRNFVNLPMTREVYNYIQGKLISKSLYMIIPDNLYRQALTYVKNRELKTLHFMKSISELHENSKRDLREIIRGHADEDANLTDKIVNLEERMDSIECKLDNILEILKSKS